MWGSGKRTTGGLINDGVKSVTRYYLNNFQDGAKQDAMDYATGNYKVQQGGRPPAVSAMLALPQMHTAASAVLGATKPTILMLPQAWLIATVQVQNKIFSHSAVQLLDSALSAVCMPMERRARY